MAAHLPNHLTACIKYNHCPSLIVVVNQFEWLTAENDGHAEYHFKKTCSALYMQ